MIYLGDPFERIWEGKNVFDEIRRLNGVVYRNVLTRKTINFKVEGESFYLKVHQGTTIFEILKNLLQFKFPVLGAKCEYLAIKKLHSLNINTMTVAAFGEAGLNPLRKISFIITKDLNPAISLEDYCAKWKTNPPSYEEKKSIICALGKMVRDMHAGGVNHRDCYLCHFLLHLPFVVDDKPILSVIDLHRAQIRKRVPKRWRDKDLAALYYSSLNLGLSSKDYWRFLKIYLNLEHVRLIVKSESDFLDKVIKKAEKIAERTLRKGL